MAKLWRKLKLKSKSRQEDKHPGCETSNHLSSIGKKENACIGRGRLNRKCPPVDLFSAAPLWAFTALKLQARFEPGPSFEALASRLGLDNVHTCDRDQVGHWVYPQPSEVRLPSWLVAACAAPSSGQSAAVTLNSPLIKIFKGTNLLMFIHPSSNTT